MSSLPSQSARSSPVDCHSAVEETTTASDMDGQRQEVPALLTEEIVSKIPSQTLLEKGLPEYSPEPPQGEGIAEYDHRVSHLDDKEVEEELDFLMGSLSLGPQPHWLSPDMVQAADDRLKASSTLPQDNEEESPVKKGPSRTTSRPPTSSYTYAPAGLEKRDINLLKVKVTRKGGGGFALRTPSREPLKIAKCSVLSTNGSTSAVMKYRWIPGKVRVQRTEEDLVKESIRTGLPVSPRLTREHNGPLPVSAYIPKPHRRMPHANGTGPRVKEMREWLRSITPNPDDKKEAPEHAGYQHMPGHHVPVAHIERANTKRSQSAARQKARLGYCPQKGCPKRNRVNEHEEEKFADFEAVVSKAEQITMEYEMKLLEEEEEARKAEERMENMIGSPRSTRVGSPISTWGSPTTPRLLETPAAKSPESVDVVTDLPSQSRQGSLKEIEVVKVPQTRPTRSPPASPLTPQKHQNQKSAHGHGEALQQYEEIRMKGPMEAMIEDDLCDNLAERAVNENQPPKNAAEEGGAGKAPMESEAAGDRNTADGNETEGTITKVPERPKLNFSSEPLQPWGDSEDNGQMARRQLPQPSKPQGDRLIPVIRFQDRSGLAKRPAKSKPWVHREPMTDDRGSRRPRRKLPFGSGVVRTQQEENRRRQLMPSQIDLGLNRPNTAGGGRKWIGAGGRLVSERARVRPESQLSVSGWSQATSRTAGPSPAMRPQSVVGYMRPDSVMTQPVTQTESIGLSDTGRPHTSLGDALSERPSSVATVLYDLQVPVLDVDSEDESIVETPPSAPTHQASRPNSAGVVPSAKRIPTTGGWQDGARMQPKSPKAPDRQHSRTPPPQAHRRIITITMEDKKKHPGVVFEGEGLPPPGTSRPHNADLYPIPSERRYTAQIQDSGALTARF